MDEEACHVRCNELFVACAPFVRAEYEAEERLKEAQEDLRKARKTAAAVRAAWVNNILKHDHQKICRSLRRVPKSP